MVLSAGVGLERRPRRRVAQAQGVNANQSLRGSYTILRFRFLNCQENSRGHLGTCLWKRTVKTSDQLEAIEFAKGQRIFQ